MNWNCEKWWDKIGKHYWSLDNENKPATKDQQFILYETWAAIQKGYENIIWRVGVGFGKSAMAKTIANMYDSSYILTNNIALQKQYANDFDDVKLLMGRGKYSCNEWDNSCERCYMEYITNTNNVDEKLKYLNVSETWTFPEINSDEEWERYKENVIRPLPMWKCNSCPYKIAKNEAKNSNCTVCNYHSLYFNSNIINTFGSRDVILFDEGHYFENILCQINYGSLNPESIYEKYNIDILEHNEGDDITNPMYWVIVIEGILNKIKKNKAEQISKLQGIESDAVLKMIAHEYNKDIKKWEHKQKIISNGKFAINVPDDFDKPIILEPIFSKSFNNDLLKLGEIRIFMSGTFPPKQILCDWFGLDYSKTHIINKYPNFPIKNRPVIKEYVGRINRKENSWNNKKMKNKLIEICEKHDLENGVIHCTTNDHVEYICDILEEEGFDPIRCYGNQKQDAIDEFIEYGGILVGSNIREGLDLKGDLCTFQILFKVPYPIYGEKVKVRQAEGDPFYYPFHTCANIEQAYGRGLRTPSDICPFYILDECFENLIEKNSEMISQYFKEAIL